MFSIQDIDECAYDTNPCGIHECVNKPGSYDCKCTEGYIKVYGLCVGEYMTQMLVIIKRVDFT